MNQLNAQTADQLIKVKSEANTTDMQNISTPLEGSLVYLESEKNLFLRTDNTWGSFWSSQGNKETNSSFIGTTSAHDFKIRTNNIQRMVVKDDGNVGINLENPTGIFHVNAGVIFLQVTQNITVTASSERSSSLIAENAIDNNNNTYWASATVYTPQLFINPVWITLDLGTPKVIQKYRLETSSFGPKNAVFQGSNNNSDWDNLHELSQWGNSGWTELEYTISDQQTAYRYYRLRIQQVFLMGNPWQNIGYAKLSEFKVYEKVVDNSIEGDFLVHQNGNIGISVANPTKKLHVSGNILASGSITPDYVFENYFQENSELNPDYEFNSLNKVKEFVKENKHLPGVLSAKEIEKQGGIIVNKTTEINLEKIEELYLHLFELNEKNQKLENQIAKLEKMLLKTEP